MEKRKSDLVSDLVQAPSFCIKAKNGVFGMIARDCESLLAQRISLIPSAEDNY